MVGSKTDAQAEATGSLNDSSRTPFHPTRTLRVLGSQNVHKNSVAPQQYSRRGPQGSLKDDP